MESAPPQPAQSVSVPGPGDGGRDDQTDRSLAEAFRRGDAEAWQCVVASYGPRLQRIIGRLLKNASLADDVLQEVFVAAWTHHRRFRGDSQLMTWLTRIAVNQCRAKNRQAAGRRRLWSGWLAGRVRQEEQMPERPEAALDRSESGSDVRRAVDSLAEEYREVVVLFYLEDMASAEVAETLGLRDSTVRVRLTRARQLLRQQLTSLDAKGNNHGRS
ncbi:MAG: sigma-70 family RNA polymerase sigma factor [Pirellulales bacterium]